MQITFFINSIQPGGMTMDEELACTGEATEQLMCQAPESPPAQQVMGIQTNQLQTWGMSDEGARQSLSGEQITAANDKLRNDLNRGDEENYGRAVVAYTAQDVARDRAQAANQNSSTWGRLLGGD
jgi:hypothetical protein